MKKIFIIAGEKSGDNLGAKLIKALRENSPEEVLFYGIGSEEMEKEGLQSLFPMNEINLMGFAEIIPHLPNLINRINQAVEEIININPDVVITIDSPGFNYRVVQKLREKKYQTKFVHYVAPSVWAYKEKRAEKTAKLFDLLLCLLPWEPSYFKKHGLKTVFIGHPLFEDLNYISESEKTELRKSLNLNKFCHTGESQYQKQIDFGLTQCVRQNDKEMKIVSILAGSRFGEIKKILPTIKSALKELQNKYDILPVFLGVPHLKNHLEKNLEEFPEKIIITDISEKQKFLQISDVAIVKSGTVSLEVTALKCPQIVIYKVSPISHFIMKRMIKTDLVNLINISAKKEIIPERIQDKMTVKNIVKETSKLLKNKTACKEQLSESELELMKMGYNSGINSSQRAAEEILGLLNP